VKFHRQLVGVLAAGWGSLILGLLPCVAAAQAVALVIDRTGAVLTTKQGVVTAVPVLAALPTGTRVQLQANSSVTLLYLRTGDEYTLTGPGECELKVGGPSFDATKMQRRATEIGAPVRLRVDNITLGGVVMRSGNPRPLYPVGQVMVRPAQLAWSSLLSEARFLVDLRDASGALLMHEQTAGLSLLFPPDIPLEAGQRYAWAVSLADDDEATATISSFEMASVEVQARALRLKPLDTAPFAERVVYALWLEQAGAVGEARQFWETLAKERPDEAAMLARSRR
jgi:hypothetical protein